MSLLKATVFANIAVVQCSEINRQNRSFVQEICRISTTSFRPVHHQRELQECWVKRAGRCHMKCKKT